MKNPKKQRKNMTRNDKQKREGECECQCGCKAKIKTKGLCYTCKKYHT